VIIFDRRGRIPNVNPIVLSAVGMVVGGTLAGVTLVGVIESQTDAPGQSPANVSEPIINYGTGQ